MNAVAPLDEVKLREQHAAAREKLDGLVRKLRAVDGELEALAPEKQQHRLLDEACAALEKLGALGGAQLFWGERSVDREGGDHIRSARGRLDEFQKRLSEIEDRREALLDDVDHQQRNTWFIEDDILEAQEQAELRAQEWIVEREVDAFPVYSLLMPWTRGGEDDRRFRKALATSLGVGLLLFLLLPLVGLPRVEPPLPAEPTERLTRLIPERPRTPPPIAPAPQERKLQPVEKPALVEKAVAQTGPQHAQDEAPGAKGILAFKEQLAGLADTDPTARLGLKARIDHAGEAPSGPPERSMVTSLAPGSSGGVNLAALSRGVGRGGGQALEGVQVARATSAISAASGSGGGTAHGVGNGGPSAGRTDEEIQIVFDRHKAGLYRLYNRELRSDPTLKGQMVLRLRIEPDGSVSLCELQGTDMNAPDLSAQVVERVKTFDFGAKDDIPAITILYPIDFLPAT